MSGAAHRERHVRTSPIVLAAAWRRNPAQLRTAAAAHTRGFTLLEVLVAVAVLGVAVVTLLGLQARNIKLAADTRDLTVAGLLAASLAAPTKGGPFPEAGTGQGTITADDEAERAGSASSEEQYGGVEGAERFVWRRTVEPIGFKSVRLVHVAVSLAGAERPLATMDFLVRKGGP
jgi:prepilin-type N-terminal cleavage/methylation domain-containing protein